MAGVLISIGDHKTRKKDVLERIFRQDLTWKAMRVIDKRKEQERSNNKELEEGVDPLSTPEIRTGQQKPDE
jgi:hypothetical protein